MSSVSNIVSHEAADSGPEANRKSRTPMLPRHLSDAELAIFKAAGPVRTLGDDEIIFRKGELGRAMFVIESGEVRLEFGGDIPDKIIGPREFFGELALFIGNHARVANAVAVGNCALRVIEHAAYERLVETEPALLAQFMRRSFAYLVASEQQLISNLTRRNEDLMVTLDSLRQTQTQLSTANRLIRTDELTGLTNRRGLYHFLESLGAHRIPGLRMGLILIDLDRFKQINDRCGHLIGDEVLRVVAAEVANASAPCDLPCRIGGDEFALLVQIADGAALEERAERIVAGIRALRFPPPNERLRVSVSVGANLCSEGNGWSTWYSEADSALYHAKGEGGDNWRRMD
ncbi:MAG TPA: GGDEF domain-containing protein [Rudaea sp.]